MNTSTRPAPHARDGYRHFLSIQTRWLDNDAYGHVNNVVYYGWFDTVVNQYLIGAGVLDVERGQTIGLVVDTRCTYFSELAFPQVVVAALRVARIGRASVTYEIGIFAQDAQLASAQGHFVHVYVDRATRRPVDLPPALHAALRAILV